ncbi:hydroxyacid dehydrogenase [Actinomyces vulturis]|uniref:hydroxyacid dehydrogenase n=1 Tax=Actinomyces vulturis TaxID=1857645 RepID=UPI000830BD96|nr:hydroxyacid dehydrogenase [Actinomyces vulturis]
MTSIVMSVVDTHLHKFFNERALDRLRALGELSFDPDPLNHATEESRAMLREADIVVTCWETGSFDELLDDMPNLRLVVHSGGSIRAILGPEAFDRGIRMSSQTQVNAEPVAQYTVAMILLALKDIFHSHRRYVEKRDKDWQFWDEFENIGVYGATVGLIGLSRISRRVIDLLKPFNVNIKVQSGHLSDDQARELGVSAASMEEILSTSDVVSLHSASTPRTYHMLGAEHFAMMRDGVTFINTARGAICDQDALIEELKKDRIRAIIDVTDPEVCVPDSPLYTLPNVFLTPHAAGSMGRELFSLGDGAVNDVANYIMGGTVAGEILANEYNGRA